MKHKMQHADFPTWCVNCGTFDMYCQEECKGHQGKYEGEFDSSRPEIYARMREALYGVPETAEG